eukprot:07102.XXX_22622_22750_1 [CDS] Oithona nana genome sequencing.
MMIIHTRSRSPFCNINNIVIKKVGKCFICIFENYTLYSCAKR